MERNRFLRDKDINPSQQSLQVEQLVRNQQKEKAILKGYAIRVTFAFVPQALRYILALMVNT